MAYLKLTDSNPRGSGYLNLAVMELGAASYGSLNVRIATSSTAAYFKTVSIPNSSIAYNGSSYYTVTPANITGLNASTTYHIWVEATPSGSWARIISDYYNTNGVWYDIYDNYGTNSTTAQMTSGWGRATYATLAAAPADDTGASTSSNRVLSTSLNGSIETGGDKDWYKFTATTTGDHVFYVDSTWDTYGTLFNSSGSQLLTSDDDNGSNPKITYNMASGTVVYFEVRGYSATTTGAYTVYVTKPAAAPADDTGASTSSNRVITTSLSGNIETTGDKDWYKYTATMNGNHVFRVESAWDTYGTLYNSSGTSLITDDDGGTDYNPRITYNLVNGSVYYFEVKGYGDSGTGTYTAYVDKPVTPATPSGVVGLDDVYGQAGRLDNELRVKYAAITNADQYEVQALNSAGTIVATATTTAISNVSLIGVGYGQGVTLKYRGLNTTSGTAGGWSGTNAATTQPQSVGLNSISDTGPTSIAVSRNSTPTGNWSDIEFEMYPESSGTILKSIIGTGTTATFNDLTAGTVYRFKARTRYLINSVYLYSDYSNLVSGSPNVEPPAAVVTTLTDVGGQAMNMNVSGGAGSTTLSYEIREGSSTGTIFKSEYDRPTGTATFNIQGLKENTTYFAKAWGKNAGGTGTGTWVSAKTYDITPPTASIISTSGTGTVQVRYSGADQAPPTGGTMTGLTSFAFWISLPNDTNLGSTRAGTITDTSLEYFTFQWDQAGNEFVHNASYSVGVRSYDAAGNPSALATATIVYKASRPLGTWGWSTNIASGADFNVKAVDWVSLGKRINAFRTYKDLSTIVFTVPSAGQDITYTIYNEYVNGINPMLATANRMPTVSKDQEVFASHFTNLSTKLESIQ